MLNLISSRRCIAFCATVTITATFFPGAVFAGVSPESSKIQGEAITSREGELKTNTLLDDSTTIDLHNDNTILRDVKVTKEDDIEGGDWTDLDVCWVSRLTPRPYTITVGN